MAENVKLTDLIRGLKHTDRVLHAHLEQGGTINRKFGYKVRGGPANAPGDAWRAEEKYEEDKAPPGQFEQ